MFLVATWIIEFVQIKHIDISRTNPAEMWDFLVGKRGEFVKIEDLKLTFGYFTWFD